MVTGTLKERCKQYSELTYTDDWTFLVISYETYRQDVFIIQRLFSTKGLDFCILDEAQKIKNSQSRIGTYIHYAPYKFKYLLTATPLPNTPLESYNYLRWGGLINEEFNWWMFRQKYAIFGGYNNNEIIAYKNIVELRNLIQDNMLRRLKKDKLKELPDISPPKMITVKMLPQQETLYNAVRREIAEDLMQTNLERVPVALAKLVRLQQITDSPALIGVEKAKSSKLDALDELLEALIEQGKEKVIVFSKFRQMVEILATRYRKYKPAVIHGGIDANGITREAAIRSLKQSRNLNEKEREELIQDAMTSARQKEVYKFQQDPQCRIFIGCTPACREGLTLTAATHVVFYDNEWSPAYVEQAYSRAHRIGQKSAVTVYNIVCENTIDTYVQEILKRKDAMVSAMLDGDNDSVPSNRAREVIAEMIGLRIP